MNDGNELVHFIQKFIDKAVEQGILTEGNKVRALRGFAFEFVRSTEEPEDEDVME